MPALIEVGFFELNRNPENVFAEVEQVAFSPANVVPGISFSPGKMLQARCSPMETPSAGRTRGFPEDICMFPTLKTSEPTDAAQRRAKPAVTVYEVNSLPAFDTQFYERVREGAAKLEEVVVPPRDARAIKIPAGYLFRVVCSEGPQVGDLNLWNAHDLTERFFSGKTRALHATHVTTGHRLWSTLPHLRPLATITHDTLDWYGWDADGAGIHDVIGTRCDPYTNVLLKGVEYHHCCHSNLTRALAATTTLPLADAEVHVHDVLNVFMCTGFTRDTHQYFMKASPVRAGDFIEFFAEIDLIAALSACPGGDCGATHSDDAATCYPLMMQVFRPQQDALTGWRPAQTSAYSRSHGA